MIFWLFYSFSNKVVDVSQCECGDEHHCIVFVEANTNCLPLGWVMFITLLRRDPHLNQVETESSQTLISKVNHGTTPAVDISFY